MLSSTVLLPEMTTPSAGSSDPGFTSSLSPTWPRHGNSETTMILVMVSDGGGVAGRGGGGGDRNDHGDDEETTTISSAVMETLIVVMVAATRHHSCCYKNAYQVLRNSASIVMMATTKQPINMSLNINKFLFNIHVQTVTTFRMRVAEMQGPLEYQYEQNKGSYISIQSATVS